MNMIKFRRNCVIIIGMVILNILFQIYMHYKGVDMITIISYVLINVIWSEFVKLKTRDLVRMVEEEIEKGDFD
jgi:hypothetical protein